MILAQRSVGQHQGMAAPVRAGRPRRLRIVIHFQQDGVDGVAQTNGAGLVGKIVRVGPDDVRDAVKGSDVSRAARDHKERAARKDRSGREPKAHVARDSIPAQVFGERSGIRIEHGMLSRERALANSKASVGNHSDQRKNC